MSTRRPPGGDRADPVPGGEAAAGEPGGADPGAGGGAAAGPPAAPLAPGAVPRVAGRCAWQVVEGEAVLLDLAGRRIMGLNPTGSFVFQQVDGVRTVAQIGALVAARFGVDLARAEADAASFLGALAARGLVEVAA